MSGPVRRHRWRSTAAAAALLVAAGVLPAVAAPVRVSLSPVIVQASSAPVARAAVELVIAQSAGVGRVLHDLPLVNGVVAELTALEADLLDVSYAVTADAVVRTQRTDAKPSPPSPPTSLVNVFREVTGAQSLVTGGTTGAGVGVAVVDTGIANLPDFAGRLRTGVDLSGEGSPWSDGFGHGTFVAGLVAGDGASSGGRYAGEAPGAHLVPVKVAGRSGSTTLSTVIRGLQWVVDNSTDSIRVVNLSMGAVPTGPTRLNPLVQAVEAVWRQGIVVVASAGNSGATHGTITTPGDSPLVITVGSTDDRHTVTATDDVVPGFSSRGPSASDAWWKPDLLAPGTSLVSVTSNRSTIWGSYRSARVGSTNFVGSGTSFSAALVSGAAAMLLQESPASGPDEVKAALLTTTNPGPGDPNDSLPHDPFAQGHGVLDVARAVAQPPITMVQGVAGVVTPPLGSPILVTATQLVSTWAPEPGLLSTWPLPYSGPATTSVASDLSPLLVSAAWNSSAWNGSAWNGSAWNGSAWNGSAWNGSAWNGSAWNGSAWNGSAWSSSAWNGSAWNGSAWN